jgi:hypothetical protein
MFRFAGLSPGRYDGMVQAGQCATHAMQSLAALSGRPLVLKQGDVRELNVPLTRTRAIDVRVVDSWGNPLSGLRVTARTRDTGRDNASLSQHTTDDLGRLRIVGLLPGRYTLCAEGDALPASASPGTPRPREGLLRTCYPSATNETEAEAVPLTRADYCPAKFQLWLGARPP